LYGGECFTSNSVVLCLTINSHLLDGKGESFLDKVEDSTWLDRVGETVQLCIYCKKKRSKTGKRYSKRRRRRIARHEGGDSAVLLLV
jgi:hypothetical protein